MKPGDYLKELKKRADQSRVHHSFQLHGLEIAQILGDEEQANKAIYIRLAKTRDPADLRRIAAEVAENPKVKNKIAYFLWRMGKDRPARSKKASKKK